MSLIDFYYSGSSADSLKDYNYSTAYGYGAEVNTDLVRSEPKVEETNPLLHKERKRVVAVKEKLDNREWIVDGAITVKGFHSTLELQKQENYWNQNFNITLATGIVSTILGVGCGAATFFVAATWLKVTCIVAMVALVLFAALSFYRAYEASEQAAGWSVNPTTTVQNQRSLVFERGFIEAYDSSLTSVNGRKVLTRKEITYLHNQAFENWNTRLQGIKADDTAAQAAFTQEFLNSRLLLAAPTKFAIGKEKHPLLEFCPRFGECSSNAKPENAERYFKEQQSSLDAEKERMLSTADKEKEKEVASCNALFETESKKLDQARDKKLGKLKEAEQKNSEHPKVKETVDNHGKLIRELTERHDAELQKINAEHATAKTQVETAHSAVTKEIAQAKTQGYLAFYQEARDIFEGAYATLNKKKPVEPRHLDPVERLQKGIDAIRKEPVKATEKKTAA